MEIKKYPNADLDRYHNIFVEVGLVVALGVCFIAFEWKSKVKEITTLGQVVTPDIESEIIPITRQEQVRPPEPPPPPQVVEVLNIVANDVEIENELEIQTTEANHETAIDVTPMIVGIQQEKEEEKDESPVFFIVEEMPEFPGGELALRRFIAEAIKYPVIAQENGIQGKVYVSFVVGKDGMVTDARILRSVDPALDKEALRVVNNLPRWKPGRQGGENVRVSFSVPISFVLQ